MKLLLAEDDPELARQVIEWMTKAGHEVEWHEHGDTALKAALAISYDVLILDVNLPGENGFQIVEQMRKNEEMSPVLFLTARDSVTDRVRGLSAGGDDYLTKPFAIAELTARLEALYRRSRQQSGGQKKLGEWMLDTRLRRLRKANGETMELQPRELALLELLMENDGRVLTKKHLLDKVWDIRFDPGTNVVDAMICRVRRKLEVPGHNATIQTVRGKGYVFKANS